MSDEKFFVTSMMLLPKIIEKNYITKRVLEDFKNFGLLFHEMKLYLHSGTKSFFLY